MASPPIVSLQVVLPAGQVEIMTTGHMEDFEDATLIPRVEIEKINAVILVREREFLTDVCYCLCSVYDYI